jgi:hypothetical protein
MPRYFLDLPEEQAPRSWDPHSGPHPRRADTRYFGAVFLAMEPLLSDPRLDIYLTWDWERLPAYGETVVAVLLGDEVGRIPRYTGRVRAVFKCYGTHPVLGVGAVRDRSLTGLANFVQYGVRWVRWLPSGVGYARLVARARFRGPGSPPAVTTIPLGTYNQLDLPVVPIEQRSTDLFFAGSVEHKASLRHRLGPKSLTRHDMLTAVRRLAEQRPGLRLDLRLTPDFGASAAAAPGDLSRGLMDSKVCLAPRGTSVETFRLFEGLRAGCVVVAGRLPPHPFYAGAPVIQLDRWSELDRALPPVLDLPAELRRLHGEALAWWRDHCSEEAVGRFLAEKLNETTQHGSG